MNKTEIFLLATVAAFTIMVILIMLFAVAGVVAENQIAYTCEHLQVFVVGNTKFKCEMVMP